jgi:hypothetical protein
MSKTIIVSEEIIINKIYLVIFFSFIRGIRSSYIQFQKSAKCIFYIFPQL